jgi:hypothetical protein
MKKVAISLGALHLKDLLAIDREAAVIFYIIYQLHYSSIACLIEVLILEQHA